MASVASQLTEEVTAYAQSDSLEDAQEIRADGAYFPNNLRTYFGTHCTVFRENSFVYAQNYCYML